MEKIVNIQQNIPIGQGNRLSEATELSVKLREKMEQEPEVIRDQLDIQPLIADKQPDFPPLALSLSYLSPRRVAHQVPEHAHGRNSQPEHVNGRNSQLSYVNGRNSQLSYVNGRNSQLSIEGNFADKGNIKGLTDVKLRDKQGHSPIHITQRDELATMSERPTQISASGPNLRTDHKLEIMSLDSGPLPSREKDADVIVPVLFDTRPTAKNELTKVQPALDETKNSSDTSSKLQDASGLKTVILQSNPSTEQIRQIADPVATDKAMTKPVKMPTLPPIAEKVVSQEKNIEPGSGKLTYVFSEKPGSSVNVTFTTNQAYGQQLQISPSNNEVQHHLEAHWPTDDDNHRWLLNDRKNQSQQQNQQQQPEEDEE